MSPFFSIITPSLQRQSLLRTCESIDKQTYFGRFEHIIMIDQDVIDKELFAKIDQPYRFVYQCPNHHGNYGNRCRYDAWKHASGDMLWYMDDDNYLVDDRILEDMAAILKDVECFAILPIMRHGRWFFNDPPGLCMTDTMNVVCRRTIGRWPDIEAREADGHWVEALKANYPYTAFPQFRPIGVMEYSSNGI